MLSVVLNIDGWRSAYDDESSQKVKIDRRWFNRTHFIDVNSNEPTAFNRLSKEQQKEESIKLWEEFQDVVLKILQQEQRWQCRRATELELELSFEYDFDPQKLLDEQHFRCFYSILQQSFPKVKKLELLGDSLPDDKKALLIGDYFPNLEEFRVANYDYPLTFQTIRSRLNNLRVLVIGSHRARPWVESCLSPDTSAEIGHCILGLPTLEKVEIVGWKITGDNPRDCLGPLVCALACRPAKVKLNMERTGLFHLNSEEETPEPTPYDIPEDMWKAINKKRPIPFDLMNSPSINFDLMMAITYRRHGLSHEDSLQQPTTTDEQPKLEPWVDALIEVRDIFHRFDCFHAIFQQMPKVWLPTHNPTTIPSCQGNSTESVDF